MFVIGNYFQCVAIFRFIRVITPHASYSVMPGAKDPSIYNTLFELEVTPHYFSFWPNLLSRRRASRSCSCSISFAVSSIACLASTGIAAGLFSIFLFFRIGSKGRLRTWSESIEKPLLRIASSRRIRCWFTVCAQTGESA